LRRWLSTSGSLTAISLVLALALGLGILGLRSQGWLERLELMAADQYLALLRPITTDTRILVVEVRDEDIRRLDHWPLTDAALLRTLELIVELGARSVGVDIYRDIPVGPGTEELNARLPELYQVVMVHHIGRGGRYSIPAPAVLGPEQLGFNDVIPDSDGVVRRALLYLDDGEDFFTSLPLQLSMLWLAHEQRYASADPNDETVLRLGPTSIPPLDSSHGSYAVADAAGYQFLMDYAGAAQTFESATLTELLEGELTAERVRDRVVLVGNTAVSTNDFFHMPHLKTEGLATAGAALHAHVVSQLIRFGMGESEPRRVLSQVQEYTLILLAAALGGALGLWVRSTWLFVVGLGAGLGAFWGLGYLAWERDLWVPVVPPAAGWLGAAALVTAYVSSQEKAQRAVLMHLFSAHVSPGLADVIWDQRDDFLQHGRPRSQRMEATLLFLDMKGYTASADKMEPDELMDWANDFMEAMAQRVIEYGGFVDDYFGDGVKAGFGVLFPHEEKEGVDRDARAAVSCALAMAESLTHVNNRWRERGQPTVGMRIGVATGSVVAGSLGSENRLKYTTVGPVVQTSQRLESLDASDHDFDREPCRILVSKRTHEALDERYSTHLKGDFQLKGKAEPVTVYRVTAGPASYD